MMFVGLGRVLAFLLTIILLVSIVYATRTLVNKVSDRIARHARHAAHFESMPATATALAATLTPAPGGALHWSHPAGQIVLAAQEDPVPTSTIPPISAPTLPPTLARPTPSPSPGPDTPIPPTVIYVMPPTQPRPTVAGLYEDYPAPAEPPITAVPTRMPMADNRGEDIVNVLLLGLDTHADRAGSRSDSIIVVSLNRSTNTVNMLSVPRDLIVYIPGWTMQRINTAIPHGEIVGWRGGGPGLLRDTLLYNLGIPIHFYARVDFDGFSDIIDMVGGVDIAVDCTHQDWILKEPGLDQSDEDNWELFTLPMGVQHLDGHTALWYARSRRRTSDFDRSRRQQMILRALFSKAQSMNMFTQIPALWDRIRPHIETDMTLADMLGFVPMALQLDSSGIQSLVFNQWYLVNWTTPSGDQVLLPIPDRLEIMVEEFYLPPTRHSLVQQAARIEILNGTANPDWDRVAAARLAWEGFVPVAAGQADEYIPDTIIYDYTGQTKGSPLAAIAEALNASAANIIVEPDPDRTVDYRIILGASYNSCTYNVPAPVPTPTPDGE